MAVKPGRVEFAENDMEVFDRLMWVATAVLLIVSWVS